MKIKTALSGFFLFVSCSVTASEEVFNCKNTNGGKEQVLLTYEDKEFQRSQYIYFPVAGAPENVILRKEDHQSETLVSELDPKATLISYKISNLKKFKLSPNEYDIRFSYYTKVNNKKISLKDALGGVVKNATTEDQGHLRIEITDKIGTNGKVLYFTCKALF